MFKMIMDRIENTNIIKMRKMKPLQIGKILGKSYTEDIVMRTASVDSFEVMVINNPRKDKCWKIENDLLVELLPIGTKITLEVTE